MDSLTTSSVETSILMGRVFCSSVSSYKRAAAKLPICFLNTLTVVRGGPNCVRISSNPTTERS